MGKGYTTPGPQRIDYAPVPLARQETAHRHQHDTGTSGRTSAEMDVTEHLKGINYHVQPRLPG
jgi:hypothetical protein